MIFLAVVSAYFFIIGIITANEDASQMTQHQVSVAAVKMFSYILISASLAQLAWSFHR